MTPNDIITWLRDKLPYAPDHAWKNVMEAIIPLLGELESRRRVGAVAVINEEENERLKERLAELETEKAEYIDLLGQQAWELAQNRWIPATERLPEEEEKVLIYTKTGIVNYGTYTRRYGFDCKEGFICSDGFMWLSTASHWCCLPQPPKGE